MSYLPFSYPPPPAGGPSTPPDSQPGGSDASHPKAVSFNEETLGVHYHTWRNFISRESLAEKEDFKATNNPEKIPSPRQRFRYQDQNFIQVVQPLQVFRPITLAGGRKKVASKNKEIVDPVPEGLKGVVREAVKRKLKVKAVGSGHSFSDIATTSDFLVVTDDLDEMLRREGLPGVSGPDIRHYPHLKKEVKEDYSVFLEKLQTASRRFYGKPKDKPGLVEFEAGIKIANLNDALWARRWSLYNMGTYQGQSFIGAASTSTHGSGHTLPPLPDMIRSMVLVADKGIAFRVEPTEGITQRGIPAVENDFPQPVAKGYLDLIKNEKVSRISEDGVDFLIQDDDWFASALVNVGTFGIVYSVIIEVVPRYYLLETVEFTTWKNLRERLISQGRSLGQPDQLSLGSPEGPELFVTKTFTARAPINKNITCNDEDIREKLTRSEIRQTTIEVHPHKYYTSEDNTGEGHHVCRIIRQYKVEESVFAQKWHERSKGRTIGEGDPFVLAQLNVATEGVRHDMDKQDGKYRKDMLLTAVALLRPVSGKLDPSLKVLRTKEDIIKKLLKGPIQPDCNDYYLNRNYRTQVIALFPGYGVELGFSTKASPVNNSLPAYVDAMDNILRIAEQHWQMGRYMQSSPIAMRMVKASNAYLSMQYSDEAEPTCMIELLNQMDTNGGKELFYRYQRELFQYGARPHWGLDLSVTTGNNGLLTKMYPKFLEWKTAYDAFNCSGTFCNRFTDRMGLSG